MHVMAIGLLLGAALATPAGACPRQLHCIVQVGTPEVRLAVALASSDDPDQGLRNELIRFEPKVIYPDQVEMPWIWDVLSAEVYSRLPRYDQAEAQFSMVLAPVVVTSPSESTPGVGLSGDF